MSAKELIQQVADLPPQERTVFEHLFDVMKHGKADPGNIGNSLKWPGFAERLHDIYGDKTAPDSQKTIDEGRSDR